MKNLKEMLIGAAIGGAMALVATTVANARPTDNGLMSNVPGFGPSRVETVSFCLHDAGVDRYQDLLTDTEVETFTACMTENT